MKKLLLAILLIALIVGVAYVKDWREDRNRQQVFAEGLQQGRQDGERDREVIDSLQQTLQSAEAAFADSVSRHTQQYEDQLDSLGEEIVRRDSAIDALTNRSQTAQNAAKTDSAEQRRQREVTILAFYKQLFLALPADLSAYEKRVAIDEIRQQTADKYGITVTELNRLRDKHALSY